MKIAVFHNLPSGGAKRALYGIVSQWAATGHTVDAFVPGSADENYLPLSAAAKNLHVFPLSMTVKGAILSAFRYLPPVRVSIADLERVELQIAGAINAGDCDAVWVEQDRFVMAPFLMAALKKPYVYMCPQVYRSAAEPPIPGQQDAGALHRVWKKYALNRKIPLIDRRNVALTRWILANSNFTRESIMREYGKSAQVCYPGIDTSVFQPPAERGEEDYLLSVGSLTPAKCYDFLIRSLATLPTSVRRPLKIVANSVDPRTQQKVLEQARSSRVELEVKHGITDRELAAMYGSAIAFVYTPYREPFGLAPLEALACGTPVVAVNEGGLTETIIHGRTGILTDRDEHSFGRAVQDLLQDSKRRREIGTLGVETVRSQWSLPSAAARALHFLEEACRQWT